MDPNEVIEDGSEDESDGYGWGDSCELLKGPYNLATNYGYLSTPVTKNPSGVFNEISDISQPRLNKVVYNIQPDKNLDLSDKKKSSFESSSCTDSKRKRGRPRKEYMPLRGMRLSKDNKTINKIKSTYTGNTKLGSTVASTVKKKADTIQITTHSSQDSNSVENQTQVMNEENSSTAETDADTSLMPAPEEPPFFLEKYPGKVCALCNLGERSQLGQGEILRLEIKIENSNSSSASNSSTSDDKILSSSGGDDKNSRSGFPLPNNRRQKGLNKCKNPVMTTEYVDELEKIGHIDVLDFTNLHDSGYFYVHRSCAMWSIGIVRETNGGLTNVATVITQSLPRKCTFCSRYGASLACKMSCPKFFHFACVAASGGFQIIQNYTSFCKEHLGQVPLVCTEDINCRTCSGLGDVGNLMMCSRCGDHYHGTCIGVAQLPGVRAGWQCKTCRLCQICRVPDMTEGRSLQCEQCDKNYHATCLRPVMTSIPKYGWKCRCCRVCSDCGARTPGAGTSSRWHCHYTVCDSCYQQRNKGFSCPVCHRAYRAAAYREMVKCSICQKFVHSTCDSDAELSVYHQRKEANPDYEYVCSPCKTTAQNGRMAAALKRTASLDDDVSLAVIQESLSAADEMEVDVVESKTSSDIGLGKGKPYVASKIAKKRLGISSSQSGRPKGTGKLGYQKRPRFAEFGRKRGPKSKMRGIFGVPGLGLQRPSADPSTKTEEEPGVENRLVLCSAKDKFVLTQDICVMCGAIGTDQEGCLIACAQCGQCYHPYCANVKTTKVILQKGWRCLDCTVCEGCGQRNDEARLILCDDCDISYHIYCMDPPLDIVPHGNWKCKWCAICQKCGGNEPGVNSLWMNSFTECGPCASQSNCPSCNEVYIDDELIIQCTQCDRWLHCACDSIKSEQDAEKCAEDGYVCILCRPRDVLPPHLQPKKKLSPNPVAAQQNSTTKTSQLMQQLSKYQFDDSECNSNSSSNTVSAIPLALDGNHLVDGVCLSEHGLHQIKILQLEFNKRSKRNKHKVMEPLPPPPPPPDKDSSILASIESVVAGSSLDNSLEDVKLEPLDPKEEAEIYKDGMIWSSADSSPPEGFTLCTNEQGVFVLRKKRQRNLQKLGIGGFSVRNRSVRSTGNRDGEDDIDSVLSQSNSYENVLDNKNQKKKPLRRKQKSKLIETYPNYLQEAFFGKRLLDTNTSTSNNYHKFDTSSSDDDTKSNVSDDKTIKLSLAELKLIEDVQAKQQQQQQQQANQQKIQEESARQMRINTLDIKKMGSSDNISTVPTIMQQQSQQMNTQSQQQQQQQQIIKTEIMTAMEEEDNSEAEALKELCLPDLLTNDLVNTIINDDEELTKTSSVLDDLTADDSVLSETLGQGPKDELTDILSSNFTFNMDSKDVEEIFKGVLTDESQESQESSVFPNQHQNYSSPATPQTPNNSIIVQQQQIHHNSLIKQGNSQVVTQQGIIHVSQQQSSGQQQPKSPAKHQLNVSQQPIQMNSSIIQQQIIRGNRFNVPPFNDQNQSQWVQSNQQNSNVITNMEPPLMDDSNMSPMTPAPSSYNQKSSERMKQDEVLGDMATISAVLYSNKKHPELKADFPVWTDRCKQILKKWRALTTEKKAPFLQQARENRSAIRMKKAQQAQQVSPKEGVGGLNGVSSSNGNNIINTNIQNTPGNSVDLTSIVQQQPQSFTNLQHLQQQQQLIQSQQLQQQHHQQQLIEVQGTSSMDENNLDELTTTNSIINDSYNNDTLDNLSIDKNNSNPNASLELSDSCSNDITISDNTSIDNDDDIELISSVSDAVKITATNILGDGTTTTNTTTSTNPNTNSHNHNISAAATLNNITTAASNDKNYTLTTTTAIANTGTTTITLSNTNNNCHTKNENVKLSSSNGSSNSDTLNNTNQSVSNNTNANITVAANIANTFINISNLNASQMSNVVPHVAAANPIIPSVTSSASVAQNANLNVVVSQPITQHYMKTLTIGTTTRGIFVPNVIATNITPQFTVHHHQYGLHNQNHIVNGPAPNVTVNPNGNFNTNSSAAVIRPAAYHQHFRPLLQSHQHIIAQSHNSNINFNVIGNNSSIQSPILAASLQTINKIATNQIHHQQQQFHPTQQHVILPQSSSTARQANLNVNKVVHVAQGDELSMNFVQHKSMAATNATSNKSLSSTTASPIIVDKTSPSKSQSPTCSPPLTPKTPNPQRSITPHFQTNLNLNDQQIRVLTPSEIMRTLPSLSTQDSSCCYESPLNNSNATTTTTTTITTATTTNIDSTNSPILQQYPAHSQQQQQQQPPQLQQQSQLLNQASSNQSQCMSSPITITTTTSNAPPQTDQDKITAQQKSLREAEQERQWKQLQAMRAREQQIQQQLPASDQQQQQQLRVQDSCLQLQVSTSLNDTNTSSLTSPNTNSRNQFIAPSSKGRSLSMSVPPQSPSSNFPHTVIQRQMSGPTPSSQTQQQQQQPQRQCQQRLNHSPFSPQSQQPPSPLDLFPEAPVQQNPGSADPFSRADSLQDNNYIHHNSPQNPRSHGQSPNQTPNRSPAYGGQTNQSNQNNTQNSAIRVHLENGGYTQAPGTPRPQQFSSGTTRPTVYARPGDLFGSTLQTSPFTSPRSDNNGYQGSSQEGNRQLRDLLQRQQMGATNTSSSASASSPSMQQSPNNQTPPSFMDDQGVQQNSQQQQIQSHQSSQNLDSITFRQPLPPSMISSRPQRLQIQIPNNGGKLARPNQQISQSPGGNQQIQGPRGIMMTSDLRQRVRPIILQDKANAPGLQQQNMNIVQQQQQQQQQQILNNQKISVGGNRINQPNVNDNNFVNLNQNNQIIHQQQNNSNDANGTILTQRLIRPHNINQLQQMSNSSPMGDNPNNSNNTNNITNSVDQQSNNNITDTAEIPESVRAELENLEQDDSAVMGEVEGVGDILGGLGDDDDDLLVSLTSDLDADFNLLEYADPELDSTDDVKTNLLDSLELDENEIEKDERVKHLAQDQEMKSNNDNSVQMNEANRNINVVSSNQGMVQHNVLQQGNVTLKSQQMHQNMQNISRVNPQGGNQQIILQQIQTQSINQQQIPPQHQQQQICNQQSPQLSNHQQLLHQQAQLNRLKNIQQIQQQMIQQVEQAAATGEPMQIGTHLVSKDGAIGIVTANNKVSVSYPGLFNRSGQLQTQISQQRIQQFRMTNPNCTTQPPQTQQPRMMLQQIQANRLVNINPINNVQQVQSPHQQVAPVSVQQQHQAPPPYPEPPPPYPGISGTSGASQSSQFYPYISSSLNAGVGYPNTYTSNTRRSLLLQEQPLLLEDLVEQEKREQAGQQHIPPSGAGEPPVTNQNLVISDQDFERLRVDVMNAPQALPAQGLLPLQPQPSLNQAGNVRQPLITRLTQPNWRPQNMPIQPTNSVQSPSPTIQTNIIVGNNNPVVDPTAVRQFPVFNANLQPPPPLPPENIVSDQDRQYQSKYEQWLNQQNTTLTTQLKYYETEVLKLRKVKKSLNSKQRQLRKNGNELSDAEAKELQKVTTEQTFVQKQLESARKHSRQHNIVVQDYNNKQQAKMQINIQPPSSPAHIAPQSPMMTSSPGGSQSGMIHHSAQSPLANSMIQPAQSPLHSPSPLMPSQSPGPASVNSIMQSPSNHGNSNSAMSPYNSNMASPRIGTPHSQIEDNPFSPGGQSGPSPSPSIPGRLTSPAPRMTSPQHRMSVPSVISNGRLLTSPSSQYVNQQQNIMPPQSQFVHHQGQNRFIRPQGMMNDQNNVRIRQQNSFQQQQQSQQIQQQQQPQQQQSPNTRQMPSGYNSPLGSPQPGGRSPMSNLGGQQQQQQQQQQSHSMEQLQRMRRCDMMHLQQMQQQQQHMQQLNQYSKQPPSPLLSQNINNPTSPMPRSPMVFYPHRSPSTGMPDRPQSADSSPKTFIQLNTANLDNMDGDMQGSNGGGNPNNPNNPIPFPPLFGKFGSIKLGLRGGSPMWGRGAKRMPTSNISANPQLAATTSTNAVPTVTTNTMPGIIAAEEPKPVIRKEPQMHRVKIIKKKIIVRAQLPQTKTYVKYNNDDSSTTSGIAFQPQQKLIKIQSDQVLKTQSLSSDDIVIIDSSPDEKQRLLDYDDDNDKSLVATEVSLSSVAQHVGDNDDIIESFSSTDFEPIVPSPLDPEVQDEYELFSSDVVEYEDSNIVDEKNDDPDDKSMNDDHQLDDSIESPLVIESPEGHHTEHFLIDEDALTMGSEIIIIDTPPMKSKNSSSIATAEDFEAMIDSKSSNSNDGDVIIEEIIGDSMLSDEPKGHEASTSSQMEKTIQKKNIIDKPSVVRTITSIPATTASNTINNNKETTVITLSRFPIISQCSSNMTNTQGNTHKKLIKSGGQTTAKVSIGNTTISVPILQKVDQVGNSKQIVQHTKKLLSQQPLTLSNLKNSRLINVGGQKTIVTLSSLNLGQNINQSMITKALSRPIIHQQLMKSQNQIVSQAVVSKIETSSVPSVTTNVKQLNITTNTPSETKMKPKPTSSSPSISYSTLSSLAVTQDTSLPTKIFEDDSISPDSSIEQEETYMNSPDAKVEMKADTVKVENDKVKVKDIVGANEDSKSDKSIVIPKIGDGKAKDDEVADNADSAVKQKQNVIPVHVIIKSRESSRSPVSLGSTGQRPTSTVPQLSPLSQPNELNTNIANAAQQLRTLMSSINNSSGIPAQKTEIIVKATDADGAKEANVVTTPTKADVNNAHTNKTPLAGHASALAEEKQEKSEKIEKPKTVTTQANKIQSTSTVASLQSQPNSVFLVKQYRTATISPQQHQQQAQQPQQQTILKKAQQSQVNISNRPSPNSNLITIPTKGTVVFVSQSSKHRNKLLSSQQPQSSLIAHNQNIVTNLTKLQFDQIKDGKKQQLSVSSAGNNNIVNLLNQPRVMNYPELKIQKTVVTTQPPALVVTSRTVTATNSTASILSATLTQPSTKQTTVTSLPSTISTILQNQYQNQNNPVARRSKSIDEVPGFIKTNPAQLIATKRHSLEVSGIVKTEPVEVTSSEDAVTTTAAIPTSVPPAVKFESPISTSAGGCKYSNMPIQTVTKSEDSQNVLLKQLLQSSNSSAPTPTQPPVSQTTTIITRPVPGLIGSQRAPSLGVVSSLEAQLARPIIPPPPAQNNPQSQSPIVVSVAPNVVQPNVSTNHTKMKPIIINICDGEPTGPIGPIPTSLAAPIPVKIITTVIPHTATLITRPSNYIAPPPKKPAAPAATTQKAVLTETSFVSKPAAAPPPAKVSKSSEVVAKSPALVKSEAVPPVVEAPTAPKSSAKAESQPVPVNSSEVTSAPAKTETSVKSASEPVPVVSTKSETVTENIVKTTTPKSQSPVVIQSAVPSPQIPPPPSSPFVPVDIKKEVVEENGSSSANQNSSDAAVEEPALAKSETSASQTTPSKDDSIESIQSDQSNDHSTKTQQELALELKKRKRREYQKNRRQMQITTKETLNPKKKARKSSKLDEDYDTFTDNLMVQLKQLPAMQILEPLLPRNYSVCPIFGATDLNKSSLNVRNNFTKGDLIGQYGCAEIPNNSDFYTTQPFGPKKQQPEQTVLSTQRGFYDQEFPPIKFDNDSDRYDLLPFNQTNMNSITRDLDTPDTIISSSSPECGPMRWSPTSFSGLRLIKEEYNEEDEDELISSRMSPVIPIIVPIPIRLKTGISLSADKLHAALDNKENEGAQDNFGVFSKSRFGPPTPLKDNSNVTVTLTLTSNAAEDILGVLRDLACILHIPPPTSYQIVERTTTPPSQKLGLYRTKGRDGKEGTPIDIQTILNGAAKFCRHCDVVILGTMIKAKSSEFPLLSDTQNNNNELESEDLYFCSKSCYKQFQWRPTNIIDDKILDISNAVVAKSKVDDVQMKLDDEIEVAATVVKIKQEIVEEAPVEPAESSAEKAIVPTGTKRTRKISSSDEVNSPPAKQHKNIRYKTFSANCFSSPTVKYKKPTEKEIIEMLFRMNITVASTSTRRPEDTRKCIFCHQIGDGVADGPSRLLNFDVDKWVHLNCALWSDGVYETVNGALMNLEPALQLSLTALCVICNQTGATIKCFKTRCGSVYHLTCAMKENCVFYKNKTTMCQTHASKMEKDNELTTLSVQRRVYVERDESRQVASVMHHSELSNLLRVGSLIFLNVGQLLPHQLHTFHTSNYIYPIGYKIIRFYWSMRRPNKRCRYICSIADVCGRPEFRVLVQETTEEDIELRDATPKAVWQRILEPLSLLRKDNKLVQLFPKYVTGEDLFGLTEPAVVRILESLPGIETLTDYRFKYGRNPLLELPLAINPSGAARTEPKLKHSLTWKKPHTQRTGSASQRPAFVATNSAAGEVTCPYSKQFVHSKSSQYKKMKQEWRNNVYLARSKIQGLGLYAARDLEKHTMVIEYIGSVIRTELSELREKQYEAKNRGIYMFRLDEERVVDATLSGGLARYINHSCNPNCTTEIVEVDREVRIIIFAKRRINRGEELSYDYKFDIEDESHKIPCMCGAPNCRKWMN